VSHRGYPDGVVVLIRIEINIKLNMNVFQTLIFGLLKDLFLLYHLCKRRPAATIAGGAAVLMKNA